MNTTRLILIPLLTLVVGCATDDTLGDDGFDSGSKADDRSGRCKSASMQSVADTLKDSRDPCHAWVKSVAGRAYGVFRSDGSRAGAGALWTRKTPAGTGIFVTSRHEFLDVPAASSALVPGQLGAPPHRYQPYFFVAADDGGDPADAGVLSPPGNVAWRLFTRPVPIAQTEGRYRALLPKNDFVVAVLTRASVDAFAEPTPVPTQVDKRSLDVSDRASLTPLDDATATIRPGDPYLAIGTWGSDDLYYSVGRAATTAEARTILETSDEPVPFDDGVEVLLQAESMPGMSGGGIFDGRGRYAGVLVRGGETADREPYIRGIKATFIVKALEAAKADLSATQRAALEPFLPSE